MTVQIRPRGLAAASLICDGDPDEAWYAAQMAKERRYHKARSSVLDTAASFDSVIVAAFTRGNDVVELTTDDVALRTGLKRKTVIDCLRRLSRRGVVSRDEVQDIALWSLA